MTFWLPIGADTIQEKSVQAGSLAANLPVGPIPYRIDLVTKKPNEMNALDHCFSVAPMMDWSESLRFSIG
jgi:hypothetical protein